MHSWPYRALRPAAYEEENSVDCTEADSEMLIEIRLHTHGYDKNGYTYVLR